MSGGSQPVPLNERQSLEQERAEIPSPIAAYRQELLDHLVPPELGGAPRDPANDWLQRWDKARK